MTSLRDFARFLAALVLGAVAFVVPYQAGETWRCATAYGAELANCEGGER